MRRAARPLYLDLEGREKKKCCANSKLDLFESDAEGKTVSRHRIRGFLIDSAKKPTVVFASSMALLLF